jgi:hypothetical protein
MSDVDTMRWGDTQTLNFVAAGGEGQEGLSSQMLNAHWQRPCIWRLMISIAPFMTEADSALTFDVNVFLFVGVGQANQRIRIGSVSFATPFAPVTQFFDIPAENMQLQFQIANLSNLPHLESYVEVTAMAAPRAEPGGISQIRDNIGAGIREPDRDGLARWPGRGFEDGELRYR